MPIRNNKARTAFGASLRRGGLQNKVLPVLVVCAVAVAGTYLLLSSKAAGPFASITASQGTLANGASSTPDATASGGNKVVFGGGSSFSLSTVFPIGVDQQPTNLFATWKSRGVNTVVDVPQGNDPVAWDQAALSAGLFEMREPSSSPASDVKVKNLIAWNQPDEPDGINSQVPYATIQSNYTSWRAAWQTANPSLPPPPVYINFTSGLNQFDLKTNESGPAWYEKYVAGADWITSDNYPVNEHDPLSIITTEVNNLRNIAGGKPVFVFLETTAYNTANPLINANQFNGEFWEAIIAGARGIWYFPLQVSPTFAFDTTPAAVAAQMTTDDALATQLAPVIQGPVNPGGISATVSSPLIAGWRSAPSGKYFFILNLSANAVNNATVTLSGIGSAASAAVYGENRTIPISSSKITDNFTPYQVHIYQVN